QDQPDQAQNAANDHKEEENGVVPHEDRMHAQEDALNISFTRVDAKAGTLDGFPWLEGGGDRRGSGKGPSTVTAVNRISHQGFVDIVDGPAKRTAVSQRGHALFLIRAIARHYALRGNWRHPWPDFDQ